jgi:hypothetical protein
MFGWSRIKPPGVIAPSCPAIAPTQIGKFAWASVSFFHTLGFTVTEKIRPLQSNSKYCKPLSTVLASGSSVILMTISSFPVVAMNFGYLATIGDNMNCLTIVTESTCLPQNIATRTRQNQTKSPSNRFRKAEATPTNQSQSRQSHQYQCHINGKRFHIRLLLDRCCQTRSNFVVQFVAIAISVKTRRGKLTVMNVIILNLMRSCDSFRLDRQRLNSRSYTESGF